MLPFHVITAIIQIYKKRHSKANESMNNEIDFEKIVEVQFHNITYLLTIRAQSHGLSLEAQEKFTGEIWETFFEPEQIQRITSTAGNLKRYPIFTKMLMSALNHSTQTVSLDLMTHRDIEAQSTRRGGAQGGRTTDPRIANKRYLIMNYMGEFDKVHYPLPLQWNSQPQNERLKLTIRRLGQEIKLFQEHSQDSGLFKELSMIKHENEILKSKIKSSLHSSFQKQNIVANNQINQVKLRELTEQNSQLAQKVKELQEKLGIKQNELHEVREELSIVTAQMGAVRKEFERVSQNASNKKQYQQLQKLFGEKSHLLEKQNKELMSELQFHREKEKKNQIKIHHLQKQLEQMIKNKDNFRTTNTRTLRNTQNDQGRNKRNRTPSKISQKRSNRSIHESSDQQPNKTSAKKGNFMGSKKNISKRKSVIDSDTESSRMRKMNNYISPYRQTQPNKLTSNRSNKSLHSDRSRSRSADKKSVKKYSNISNIYQKQTNVNRQKKVKDLSIEKKSRGNFIEEESFQEDRSNQFQYTDTQPVADLMPNQQEVSDNSSSSFDEVTGNRVQSAIANLRNRRKNVLNKQKNEVRLKNSGVGSNKSKINSIEERISSIAQGLKMNRQSVNEY